jgi:hypothetical protein
VLNALPDRPEPDASHRLLPRQPPAVLGGLREDQLEILAIPQGVFQRSNAVRQLRRGGADRDCLGPEHSTAAAFLTNMIHIRRQAVAQVDHGVQRDAGVQRERFANPRRKGQVFAKDAAAQGPGHQQPVLRLLHEYSFGGLGRAFLVARCVPLAEKGVPSPEE